MLEFDDFLKVDIHTGTIERAELNSEARLPAYKLWINFGTELGIKQSSAKITDHYTITDLIGRQILAVTNLKSRRVAGFKSEVLVLGIVCEDDKVVLLSPDFRTENGLRVF